MVRVCIFNKKNGVNRSIEVFAVSRAIFTKCHSKLFVLIEISGGRHYDRHQSNTPVGTVTAAASTHSLGAPPTVLDPGRLSPFSDTQQSGPSHSNSAYAHAASSLSSPPNNNYQQQPYNSGSNSHIPSHGGPSMYSNNNPLPQATGPTMSNSSNNNNVCISPGTVILALVILGVVLVISVTVTLWFALKRAEAKKKYAQKNSMAFNNPGPSPYYRFNHW